MRATPICIVEAIEPCLAFWESLGFGRVAEVPHGDRLGFVLFAAGDAAVMLQTRASASDDLPAIPWGPPLAEGRFAPASSVYLDVPELAFAVAATAPFATVLVPERTTFYGAREVWLKAPGGVVVGLAQER